MLVYRVENSRRGGPYGKAIVGNTGSTENRPHPSKDGMGTKINWNGMLFGFQTMEELWEWFDDYREVLAEKKFRIATYEVHSNDVLLGGHQLAFWSSGAIRHGSVAIKAKELALV